MTTGRINQVAARALSPLQLGKAHESRPIVHYKFPLVGRNGFSSGYTPTTNFRSSLRTLNVPTGMCTPWEKVPSGTRAKDTANFGGLLYSRHAIRFLLLASPGRKDLPCASRLNWHTGSACVPVRGLLPLCVGEGPREMHRSFLCRLDSQTLLPYICFGE